MKKHTFTIEVSWNTSEPAYSSHDMWDALMVFASIIKEADGMEVLVKDENGRVMAAYPVQDEEK